MDIIKREFEVRQDEESGLVSGIAVPYDNEIEVGGIREKFVRGSIDDISDTKLFYGHSEPIGKVVEGRDTEQGYEIVAKISDTPKGQEIRTLLKDGVLTKFSVGFTPVQDAKINGVIVREKVKLREVSVVSFPAYENAKVLSVREANTQNKENTQMNESHDSVESEISVLRDGLSELERRVDVIGSEKPSTPAPAYRSYGDYIKGFVRGEEEAHALFRAYTGGTSADAIVKDAWVGDVVDVLNKPRKVLNAFTVRPLPSEGLAVEYAYLSGNTTDVTAQAAEGDVLAFGKVEIDSATAPVKTYGGYTTLSRQEIERASHVSIVQTSFEALSAKYGAVTNAAVQTAYLAAISGGSAQSYHYGTAALDASKVIGAVVEAAGALETYNLSLDGFLVALDKFKELASLVDGSGRPLVAANHPSNDIGGASAAGLSGNLLGVPLIVCPSLPAGTWTGFDKSAVVTFEAAGAPLRLTDGDITNLTNHFSVYGYAAVAVEKPKGIVEMKKAA